MKQRLVSLMATAAIFTTAATAVQAEEVTVQKGDTLWGFSQEYGVSVESIKKWNNLSSDLIHPNDILTVSPFKTITVQKGDTLWGIAQVNGVTVEHLMEWNKLSSDLIHPGLNLKIYTNNQAVAQDQTQSVSVKASESKQAIQTQPTPKLEAAATKEQASQAVSIKKEAETVEAPKKEVETVEAPKKEAQPVENQATGNEITVEATAYTASCEGCSGITSTGINLKENPDMKVISVDPSVIPLGSKVHVEGYGNAIAADTGGAIKGNKIDVFVPNHDDAVKFGRQEVKVKIID